MLDLGRHRLVVLDRTGGSHPEHGQRQHHEQPQEPGRAVPYRIPAGPPPDPHGEREHRQHEQVGGIGADQ
ncbi:hypothetical protein ACL02O_09715 [Micromonospora sp. MS34]|uniref:hypothetical protein n=1 Tax=Micromonospora sp. MS34 TaxID=3385971 RepID=UPI0039A2C573